LVFYGNGRARRARDVVSGPLGFASPWAAQSEFLFLIPNITTETVSLARVVEAGGGDTALCVSNPLSTPDDVATGLVRDFDMPVFADRGADSETYCGRIRAVLDRGAQVTMDDGADRPYGHEPRREDHPRATGAREWLGLGARQHSHGAGRDCPRPGGRPACAMAFAVNPVPAMLESASASRADHNKAEHVLS